MNDQEQSAPALARVLDFAQSASALVAASADGCGRECMSSESKVDAVAGRDLQNRRMGSARFTATLVPRGPAAAIVLEAEQVAAVGEGAKRFPVVATVNDYTWRTTVTRMGGEFLLGLNRAVREQAGVEAGDTVAVTLALDTAPREVEVPEALATALAEDSDARAAFDSLAYTHRKEYARWIDEAKRDETRRRRVAQALDMLRQGKTRT